MFQYVKSDDCIKFGIVVHIDGFNQLMVQEEGSVGLFGTMRRMRPVCPESNGCEIFGMCFRTMHAAELHVASSH